MLAGRIAKNTSLVLYCGVPGRPHVYVLVVKSVCLGLPCLFGRHAPC